MWKPDNKYVEPLDASRLRLKEEVKAAPFPPTLKGFVTWLETKPADTAYDYYDLQNCLYAQFSKENGYWVNGQYKYAFGTAAGVAVNEPWTFGDALSRARSYLQASEGRGSHPHS